MTEKYAKQLEIEKLNKEIIEKILLNVQPKDFIAFYVTHTQKETMAEYGLRTTKQLIKLLKLFNYDFSTQKPSKYKGKTAARSHESYVLAGKKSAETQKQRWCEKSDKEKNEWSIKQSQAHSTDSFRNKIREINKEYWQSLSEDKKQEIREKKSKSAKARWSSFSKDEQIAIMENRFKNGRLYNSKETKPNLSFAKKLTENDIDFEREYCLNRKLYDFKLNNILIEIDPAATHNSTWTPFEYSKPLDKYYHRDKSAIASANGFRCIHVFDWDDQDKIISLLKNERNTLYAKNCAVQEISVMLAKDFILKNHLQNYVKDEIRLGLFNNGRLVSIMTFGKPRYNKNFEYELLRYCSDSNIIGGAEKLFKHFINSYSPISVVSYCDLSKFSGTIYERLGFELKAKPVPSKHWYNMHTKEHYTDALLRQQGFSRLVHHCDASEDNLPTNNNRDLMIGAGFVEIFDCGQATYCWQRKEAC